MIIYPSEDGANAIEMHDVRSHVAYAAIDTS